MRTLILSLATTIIAIGLILIPSCEKENNEPANQPPTLTIINPSSGDEIKQGEIVIISAEANDVDGNLKEVRFYIDSIGVGYSERFPHNFEWKTVKIAEGRHEIRVVALDEGLAMSKDSLEVIIIEEDEAPVAKFSVDHDSIIEGANIQFADESSGVPTEWEWDFGDGNTSNEKNPVHSYLSDGTYSIRLRVANEYGTDKKTKTNFIKVTNAGTGTFTDPRDGQTYETIQIGDNIWFAENLNYEIENSWWYENDSSNGQIYGRLYTQDAAWLACPAGWHLPNDFEWGMLETELGMDPSELNQTGSRGTDQGEQLKSASGWDENGNGTNSSGFNALPGGIRVEVGYDWWRWRGTDGVWWTSDYVYSPPPFGRGVTRSLISSSSQISRGFNIQSDTGLSVRCIKD